MSAPFVRFDKSANSGQNVLQRDETTKASNDDGLQVGVHLQFAASGIQVLFESSDSVMSLSSSLLDTAVSQQGFQNRNFCGS